MGGVTVGSRTYLKFTWRHRTLTRTLSLKVSASYMDAMHVAYASPLALASLLASIVSAKDVSHIFAAHTAVGKNVFPRLAGLLDSSLVGRHRTHSAFFH